MDLTIKNFGKVLSKELLKQAEKAKVRECDEIEKGRYVAYVDEGQDSFDVSIELSSKKQVTGHSCECNSNTEFCRHKAGLLLHIAAEKKVKPEVKARKKVSKTEALLEDVDTNELKQWVKDVLQKNKDLELSFLHYFSSQQQQYTPDAVISITYDAIKAVVGNKKNVDTTQLKKLVDLWAEVHAPIVNYYRANVMEENAFNCFHTLLESCRTYYTKINTSSNKITKYIEGLLQYSVESIHQIVNEESWDKAVSYFIQFVHDGPYRLRLHYLQHLQNIVNTSSAERKQWIIQSLAELYKKHYSESIYEAYDYTRILFNIIVHNGMFAQYSQLLRPIRFDNGFNQQLIQLLIDQNELTLAEKYCQEQIQGNFREEYNVLYLLFLKIIYKLRKEEAQLADVLNRLFPYYYDFNDYQFIINRMPEEERKNWRTKMLSRARNASLNYNKDATRFVFQLMAHENQYSKMIGYIDHHTPYKTILEHFEPMVLTDKDQLLKAIMNKKSNSGPGMYFEEDENEEACFPQLFELMRKHYTEQELQLAIRMSEKNTWYLQSNSFLSYVKGMLFNMAR